MKQTGGERPADTVYPFQPKTTFIFTSTQDYIYFYLRRIRRIRRIFFTV